MHPKATLWIMAEHDLFGGLGTLVMLAAYGYTVATWWEHRQLHLRQVLCARNL